MNTLTKEEFWNDIKEKYPEAFEHFSNWIDEYKKEVGWRDLFHSGEYLFDEDGRGGHRTKDIKFHDLPFEMQNGIIARFDIEKFYGKAAYKSNLSEYADQFINLFKDVQNAVRDRSIKLN